MRRASGRDDDIRRLIERLEARRAQGGAKLITLLGSSGSGKSSLLRPGVVPRLRRAGRTGSSPRQFRPPSARSMRCGRVGCGASEAQILIPIDQSEELGCGREPLGETVNERTWARLTTPVIASRTASAASPSRGVS
jgi:hypothetical protein